MKSLIKIFHVGTKKATIASKRRSLAENTLIKKLQFVVAVAIIFAGIMGANANASVMYNWVCDSTDCNGDPDFASSIEISDSAFAAGDFTGIIGNVLSWDTVSGVGNGFALSLDDILSGTPGSSIDDDDNLRIVLSVDRLEISLLQDISAGTNITFDDPLEGRVDFFEGSNYSVGALRDGPVGSIFSDILIQGRFVNPIPEPSTLLLMATGLAGLAFYRRKKA